MAKRRKPQGGLAFAFVAILAFLLFRLMAGRPAVEPASAPAAETEDTYALRFGEGFLPQYASRDDLGISVVLAVDSSGSMADVPAAGGGPKYRQAAEAFGQVVDVLERLTRDSPEGQVIKAGVLVFNSEVREVMPLTTLDSGGLARLRSLVRDPATFRPGGQTAIGAALERGVEWLAQSGTILRSVIVVTDGENTTGVAPAWVLSAVYNNRNTASAPDLPVFTNSTLVSFIGFDIDAGRFRALERYGARITSASDQAQLAAVLSNLLEADIRKLESSGPDGSAKP